MSALMATPPALDILGVSKRFGALIANKGISLSIPHGEIHAIVGENGAGKSTLMAILGGAIRPDSGEILIDGEPRRFRAPRDAIAAGVGVVHQHFLLVERLSVLDNIILGDEGGLMLGRGRAIARAKLATLARDHGLSIDPEALVGDLPIGLRQRVEILKALTRRARLLILDEPTAALTPNESAALFGLMRRLAATGVTIIFITHKLGEALDVARRITVLRAGSMIGSYDADHVDAATLAGAMVGRPITSPKRSTHQISGACLLRARDLRVLGENGRVALDGVSLDVHAGEIVGVAGVSGNGQSELIESLAGLRASVSGELFIGDEPVGLDDYTPARARAHGVAHIPEDRLRYGIVGGFPAWENAMLGRQHERRFGRRLLDYRAARDYCADLMSRWDVRPAAPDEDLRRFSGGNQQKIVLAREVERGSRVLLVGQPTRGVDIGAIEAIHARLLALRDEGRAILLVSVELDEILALADRILVMRDGRIVGECASAFASRREIGLMMAGATERAA